jgi:hypothetical protein
MGSIADVLRRFKQNWTEELAADAVAQACRDAGMTWYDSALNPVVTIQLFFVQVLYGNTAIEHLRHLTGLSFTAAAYCKAHHKQGRPRSRWLKQLGATDQLVQWLKPPDRPR